jgi:hypothetical protein
MAIGFAHVVIVADAVVLIVLDGNTGFNYVDTAFAAAEEVNKIIVLGCYSPGVDGETGGKLENAEEGSELDDCKAEVNAADKEPRDDRGGALLVDDARLLTVVRIES